MDPLCIAGRRASLVLMAVFMVLVVAETSADKYKPTKIAYLNEGQASSDNNNNLYGHYGAESAEQVDKLASAAGDVYWPAIMPQLPADWYQQALVGRVHPMELEGVPLLAGVAEYEGQLGRAEKRQLGLSSRYNNQVGIVSNLEPSLDGLGAFNYRAFVNEPRQWSQRQPSPVRQGRAFKPKLMSTARGFGKRAGGTIAYEDLPANPLEAVTVNGKMSGNAIR